MKHTKTMPDHSRRKGRWVHDDHFESKSKERFICSACGWWRTVKKSNATAMLFAMRHCPRCGLRMSYEVRQTTSDAPITQGEGENGGQ